MSEKTKAGLLTFIIGFVFGGVLFYRNPDPSDCKYPEHEVEALLEADDAVFTTTRDFLQLIVDSDSMSVYEFQRRSEDANAELEMAISLRNGAYDDLVE